MYGRSSKLRAACEDAGKGYVHAVPVSFTVTTAAGRKTAAVLARLVPARCWETRSCGRGCKGHRDYEWALMATSLIRVTVPEARRLLTASGSQTFQRTWSIWRRRHQPRARWHHYQAQLQAAPA